MKSQAVYLSVLFMAICALMVHCMPAKKDDENWRKKLSDPNSWGTGEFGKGGYESDKREGSKKEPKYQISGSGHDSSSAYGSGSGSHSHGSAHTGSQTDTNNNKKKGNK